MINTGFKFFRRRRRLINGVPDNYTEPNYKNSGIGDYFPPEYDAVLCPLPSPTPSVSPTRTPTPTPSPNCQFDFVIITKS